MPRKFENRVSAGLTFLDDHEEPGWRRTLIGETLAMRFPRRCVLGRLHGCYYDALRLFGLDEDAAERLGFTILDQTQQTPGYCFQDWVELGAEWEHQLAAGGDHATQI